MRKINFYLLFIALVLTALGSRAQEQAFTLEAAKQYAMSNSYILKNIEKDISIAQKKVWETITIGLPQVSGSANYNMFLNLPVSLIPGEFFGGEPGSYLPVKFGQDFNSDFGFMVSQMLFDGSYIVGVGSSQIYLNLAKQAHEKTEIDIREAVTQAYYMVLIGLEYKAVMEENLAISKKRYNETKIFFENGFREEQDVAQMKILLKTAENEVSKAEREITIAKVVLKYTMGLDLENDILLSDKLNSFLNPITIDGSALPFDFNNHIDYRLATTNFQVSEKLLKLEKVQYLPRLNAFYNYQKTSYSNDANLFKEKWYPSSLIGFQMSMPIFNSGQKRSKVQQASMELDKAENQRKLTELTLQKDYLTAVAEKESALAQFKNDEENLELAESIREKTQIKFDNGISGSAEVTLIDAQYLEATGALVNSTMALLQADLKLKKAVGKL